MNCFRNTVLQVPPDKNRSRVKVVMFSVLGFHAAILMGLLIQGCRQEPTGSTAEASNLPGVAENANQPVAEAPTNPAGAPAPAKTTAPVPTRSPAPAPAKPSAASLAAAARPLPKPQIALPAPATPSAASPATAALPASRPVTQIAAVPPASPTSGTTEYTILAGDSFGKIAKSLHATVKALENANPGVDSAKLRIGQKIRVPTASETTAQATPVRATLPQPTPIQAVAASFTAGPADEHVYTVQQGDYLFKIAKQFGVKASTIREANGLKKDQLTVGQKLKIPTRASTMPATATTTAALPAGTHAGA
jgi:LysM repeat protein